MRPFVRMEHLDPGKGRIVFVDWFLGNRCNYSCSYCPSSLHDGRQPWPGRDQIVTFGKHLVQHYSAMEKTVFIQFTGGEITLFRELPAVAAELHTAGCRIGLISNGSRSLGTWRELRNVIDMAVLTYHSEFASLPHFINVVSTLSEHVRTHVNVAVLPERFQECLDAAHQIASSCTEITLTLKPLLVDFGDRLYPYSGEQLEILAKPVPTLRKRPLAGVRGDMRCLRSDGTYEVLSATDLLLQGLNHWYGWRCNAGLEILSIDPQGFVYRGVCRQGGAVMHIADEFATLPSNAIICTQQTCHCLSDIMTSRHSLENEIED